MIVTAASRSRHEARRLVLFATGTLLACYCAVFIADGASFSGRLVVNAMANVTAGLVASAVALQVCKSLPWRLGERWWFLPAHVIGALAFGFAWFWATAAIVGTAGMFDGNPWAPVFLSGPALHWQAFTAFVLYFAVASGFYLLHATREARTAAALKHEGELAGLRARLNPHVLLNTLHSLLELVSSGDVRADDAIERFARVARYTSEGADSDAMVTLSAEHAMVQDYLALEAMRLGDRLSYHFEWSPEVDAALVPALTLQPIVENAVRHGIAPRPGSGMVIVRASLGANLVHIAVMDDGLGAAAIGEGAGSGLDLVERRLAARYGTALAFEASPGPDGTGWHVRVAFPLTR